MASWYESAVDRQIREAQERGEFDSLPGAGRPLSDHGREYDEDWWVKDWLRREGEVTALLPPTLALRRDVQDLPALVDRLSTEAWVRRLVAEVNERIRKARVGLLDGPPTLLAPLDPDAVVRAWRERRAA
jgi:Domain of unknown function (DUF1992)